MCNLGCLKETGYSSVKSAYTTNPVYSGNYLSTIYI